MHRLVGTGTGGPVRRRAWPAAPPGGPRSRRERCGLRPGPRAVRRTPRAGASGRPRRPKGTGSACSLAAALSSFREMRSSIFALARSFLAWSRCNFPNVERARATVHSFPAAGSDQVLPARRLPCRCSCRTRLCGGPLRPRAEEVGFEPTVPMRHNGFRDRPIRPLSHSSGRDASRSDLVRNLEEGLRGASPARRTRSGGWCPAPGRTPGSGRASAAGGGSCATAWPPRRTEPAVRSASLLGEERGQESAAFGGARHHPVTSSSWLSRGSAQRL